MIGWNRLLAGGFRDPLVGHDVLVGVAFGSAAAALTALHQLILARLGSTPPVSVSPSSLLGVRGAIASFLVVLPSCVIQALIWFILIFILRVILRRNWLAAVGFVLIYALLNGLSATAAPTVAALSGAAETAVLVFVMLRFGLVSLLSASFVYVMMILFPLTTDFSLWYSGAALFAVLVIAAMAAFAFHTSLAGRSLFDDVEPLDIQH